MNGNFRKLNKYIKQDEHLPYMKTNKPIDHIVYGVFDLDRSMDDFERLLGIRPVFGGYHETFGTKNALIKLNKGIYLELLAADRANTKVQKPRWMGVDVLKKERITRWAQKSYSLEDDSLVLKKYNPRMGSIAEGSRKTVNGSLLKWKLTMPLPLPEVELVPFMLDWSQSEIHPYDALPEMSCEFVELYGTHPNPNQYVKILSALGISIGIKESSEIRLKMILKSPNGIIEL